MSGIQLSSNFELNAGLPLDARFVVADLIARDAIAAVKRYDGMCTYVVSNQTTYQLQGGIANGDWNIFGGGSGGTIFKETFVMSSGKAAAVITAVNTGTKTFTVVGDISAHLANGRVISIVSSTGNDGVYTIASFSVPTTDTEIVVNETIPDATVDGNLEYGTKNDFTLINIAATSGCSVEVVDTVTGDVLNSSINSIVDADTFRVWFLVPYDNQCLITLQG